MTQVRIYWNFYAKHFSVQTKMGRSWVVAQGAKLVLLRNATFKVYEKGRQRVLAEGRKNVHAYVIGDLVALNHETLPLYLDGGVAVRYNPYKDETFNHSVRQRPADLWVPVVSAEIVSLFVSSHDTPIIQAVNVNKRKDQQ